MFAAPRTHPVLVRLAQGPGELPSDSVSTHRGRAIKVFGAEGPKLPGHVGADTQDFVLATGPAFPRRRGGVPDGDARPRTGHADARGREAGGCRIGAALVRRRRACDVRASPCTGDSIPDAARPSPAGLLWAAVAVLSFSSWFAITRLSVTRELGVADITALRLSGGALVLLPLLLRGPRVPRRAWGGAAVLSLCWGAPFVLLVGLGIQLTSAAHAAALTPGTMPVFAGLIAWIVLREKPGRQRLFGFAVIVGGVLALTLGLSQPAAAPRAWLGNLALLGGAALWATYTVRVRGTGLTPVQAAALVCLISLVAYLPIYALSGVQRLTRAPLAEVALQGLYQGCVVGGLAVVAFNQAVARLGAGSAATIVSLVPVAAALLGVALLGEVPTAPAAVAITAIAAGVFLAVSAPAPAPGPA